MFCKWEVSLNHSTYMAPCFIGSDPEVWFGVNLKQKLDTKHHVSNISSNFIQIIINY